MPATQPVLGPPDRSRPIACACGARLIFQRFAAPSFDSRLPALWAQATFGGSNRVDRVPGRSNYSRIWEVPARMECRGTKSQVRSIPPVPPNPRLPSVSRAVEIRICIKPGETRTGVSWSDR